MLRRARGFTLVEILIVIAVLGILVTIAIITWNGVQANSQNKTRETELNQWATTFDLYKSRFGFYPGMPDSAASNGTNIAYYCLGDFPTTSNKCGEYTSGTAAKYRVAIGPADPNGIASASIRTELAKVGNVPANSGSPVSNLYIGPYVAFDKAGLVITAKFIAIFTGSTCPSGMVAEAAPPMAASISGIISCKIVKTMSY